MTAQRRMDGRAALISGGGTGIGRATAERLAAEGARVFVVGRRGAKLDETVALVASAGGEAASRALDLRDPGAAAEAVDAALAWAGQLDVLASCAGTFPSAPFPALGDAEWSDALEINLAAPMRLARAAVPAMATGGGAIVNVSSTNALMGDKLSECSHYSAAKAGLLGLTRQLAVELAPAIRVNAVIPGVTDTPMLEGWNDDPAEMAIWLERYVPLRRMGAAAEIAGVVTFLASDDAAYVTGAAIPADGGMLIV